ncbi:MAG TPA: hypothetical protein VHU83_02595 [Bryobacteraceae bacterium]|jgi:hypothetical protein|nr:hypothetical protein [Bryobacteraceae bacterium]
MKFNRYMSARHLLLLTWFGVLATSAGCSHSTVHVPAPSNISATDNSYMDLQPGWRLRIIVPLLKSREFRASATAEQIDGNTISLHAADLIGYETSYYAIKGKINSGVRLEFASAEITRNGNTLPETNALTLPFQLPRHNQHIRLIYLVRVSRADHNMAIVASKRLTALDSFTKRLKESPDICDVKGEVFCSWVPAGIAVRPEQQ